MIEPDEMATQLDGATTVRPVKTRTPRRKRRNMLLPVLALVLVVAAVAFAVWAARGPKTATAKYSTAQATKDTLVVSVSASGNIVVKNEKTVQPEVSGTVKSLKVKLGQHVKKGQILYTISNPDLTTAIINARGQRRQADQGVQRAKISLLQAQQARDSLDSRPANNPASDTDISIADKQIAAAETGVAAAEDSYSAADVSYQAAKDDAAKRTVRAPISGYVTTLSLEEGDSASGSSSGSNGSSSNAAAAAASSSSSSSNSSSSGSLVISDFSSMLARVQVNEADLPNVKIGQKASLTFDAIDGLQLTGKVVQVALTGTNSQGVVTYDVDIKPTSLDKRVKPNMSVNAAITTAVKPNAVLVPNAAVKSDTTGSYVQVLGADGTPQRADVTAGASNDTYTEIVQGVTEGQSVVTVNLSQSSSSSRSGFGAMGGGGGARMMFGGGR